MPVAMEPPVSATTDYFLDGKGYGGVANALAVRGMDVNNFRPFLGEDCRSQYMPYVNREGKTKGRLVQNANAALRVREWILLDTTVREAARAPLQVWDWLKSVGTYTVPDGMGVEVMQHQTMTDPGSASISMDGLREGERDRPEWDLRALPLPLIHSNFWFSRREIETSRRLGTDINTIEAAACARRVGEKQDSLTLGLESFTYGGGTVYGFCNYPHRATYTLSDPTNPGWIPKDTLADVGAMKKLSRDNFHYGPWMLLVGTDWDGVMDEDFSDAKGDYTLRDRIKKLAKIQDVVTIDTLPGYTMILVQKNVQTCRAVIGAPLTVVQWASDGGWRWNYMVFTIGVPQLFSDINGNTGIVHGSI